MAGRRLREAVKETLVSNGGGEFYNETHIVIAGLTNTYSQYVATVEEYGQQRYEVCSAVRQIIFYEVGYTSDIELDLQVIAP